MPRKKTYKGYGFKPDREYIKQTMNMPAQSKLDWLEETNAFINRVLSKKKQEVWEKIKRGYLS